MIGSPRRDGCGGRAMDIYKTFFITFFLLGSVAVSAESDLERAIGMGDQGIGIVRERVGRLRDVIERGRQSEVYKDLSRVTLQVANLRDQSAQTRRQLDEFAAAHPEVVDRVAALRRTKDGKIVNLVLPEEYEAQSQLNGYLQMRKRLEAIQRQIDDKSPDLDAARAKAQDLSAVLRNAQAYLDEEESIVSRAVAQNEELAQRRADFLRQKEMYQGRLDNFVKNVWHEGKFPQFLLDDLDNEQMARWTAGIESDVLMDKIDSMISNTRLGMYLKKREGELKSQILDEVCGQVAQCTEGRAIDDTQRQNIQDISDMIDNFISVPGDSVNQR